MTHTADTHPVVVGIDGSRAALDAALWAIDEAVDRDVPLRLVHATGMPRPPFAPAGALAPQIEYGETSLRAASSSITAAGPPIKVEAELLWDSVEDALIAESKSASMLCVGSVGIGWSHNVFVHRATWPESSLSVVVSTPIGGRIWTI